MTPRIGEDFVGWKPPTGDDRTLGIVDFSIFPHLGLEPENTMAGAEKWAAEIAGPGYAIDDETAIRVTDGAVDVVSEGHWRLFSSKQPGLTPAGRLALGSSTPATAPGRPPCPRARTARCAGRAAAAGRHGAAAPS